MGGFQRIQTLRPLETLFLVGMPPTRAFVGPFPFIVLVLGVSAL
jgi:hypothetical protein